MTSFELDRRKERDAAPEPPAVVQLARRSVQRSLVVGPADDPAEREADAVAEQVIARLESGPSGSQVPGAPEASRIRRSSTSAPAEVGLEGGAVSAEVDHAIRSSAGGGSPLDGGTRSAMESAFGADFGNVRIHTESQVAPRIQASAFTLGNDVHFAPGAYQPGTAGGQRMLAHELTHTLQQSGGLARAVTSPVRRMPTRIQRRLSPDNTAWGSAKMAWASEGGGNGVLFVTDNAKADPVVLKTGEDADVEAMVAARLHAAMFGDLAYAVKSPGVRVVLPAEGANIKAALAAKVVANKDDKTRTPADSMQRANDLLDGAANAGTLVMEFAKGQGFDKIAESSRGVGKKQTKKKSIFSNKREVAKGSALSLIQQQGFARGLGRAMVADIFTANFDRLVGAVNFENWTADGSSISLIDNVFMSDSGFNLRDMPQFRVTQAGAEANWKNHPKVNALRNNQFQGLADPVADQIIKRLKNFSKTRKKAEGADDTEKAKGTTEIAMIDAARDKLAADMAFGLKHGKQLLLRALANPAPLLQGVPPGDVAQVRSSLENRRDYLNGL